MKKLLIALVLVVTSITAQAADNLIEDAKARIASKMKDPDSVKFADVVSVNEDGTSIVCGWINAKNSYGGYVGYTPFVVTNTYADVRSKEPRSSFVSNRSKFDEIWMSCTPNTGESFGDSLVELQDIKVVKKCASLEESVKKYTKKPLAFDCVKNENDAKKWLETHATSSAIASTCSRKAREYYTSGKSCVLEAEADIASGRGPRMTNSGQ